MLHASILIVDDEPLNLAAMEAVLNNDYRLLFDPA